MMARYQHMKDNFIIPILRLLLFPFAKLVPLHRWPWYFGRIYDIKLYGKVKPNALPSTSGSANINILIDLFSMTKSLPGDIAECGVFRGATIACLAHYCQRQNVKKTIFGFDSFAGFNPQELDAEKLNNSSAYIEVENTLFKRNSKALVENKLSLVQASENVRLVEGYFETTLGRFAGKTFCFVHLDCDLFAAYQTCLEFFYPRLVPGGIILFDEYLDPVYTECTKTIDAFFTGKPEKITQITKDNFIKYYIVKAGNHEN